MMTGADPALTMAARRTLAAYLQEEEDRITQLAASAARRVGRDTADARDVLAVLPVSDDATQAKLRAEDELASIRTLRRRNVADIYTTVGVALGVFGLISAFYFQFRGAINQWASISLLYSAVGFVLGLLGWYLARMRSRSRLVRVTNDQLKSLRDYAGDTKSVSQRAELEFLELWPRLELLIRLAAAEATKQSGGSPLSLGESLRDLTDSARLTKSDANVFLELLRVRNQLMHGDADFSDLSQDQLKYYVDESKRLADVIAQKL